MFVKLGVITRNRLPRPIFNYLSIIAGQLLPQRILWGSTFTDVYYFLKDSESWSKDKIEEYQLSQIKNTINYAYENVPYYAKLFNSNGILPKDIKTLDNLRKIPCLTKELVKENFNSLISRKIHEGEYLLEHTGGSTSEPMKFLIDADLVPRELAFLKYAWGKFDYKLGTRCIELKGAKVAQVNKRVFWKYDPLLKLLKMDSDYLNNSAYVQHYINRMSRFNSRYLLGFPSSVYLLAKQIEKNGINNIPKIELIMLASENTYDWQLDYIRRVFKCPNISYHYGHSEKAALAFKCPNNNSMHFFPQYGYTEIINKQGNNCRTGELGEIVTTSYNKCFPLIRYRTKDYARVGDNKCGCVWQNYLTASKIEGRLQEFIVTRDRRLVSICTMGAAHFQEISEVLSTQYYQDTEGKLIFRLVPFPNKCISQETLTKIKSTLENKLEHTAEVDVQIVNSIDISPSGKHLMIRQMLDINRYI
jgi:phenylacetate-CoA ligase